jgi:hypothetical protein
MLCSSWKTPLFSAKFQFLAHASGADDTFDTFALQSIQWRHIVIPGGGIPLHRVAA